MVQGIAARRKRYVEVEATFLEDGRIVPRAVVWHDGRRFPVRAVLGGPSALHDYANMDEATVNSVVASHFQRSFAARRDHAAQMRKWPQDVRALAQGKADAAIAGAPAGNRLRTGEEAENSGPTESAHSAGGGKTCR